MNNNSFFALVFREKYMKRWGLMRNANDEDLASHSAEVAELAHALAIIGNTYFGKHYDANKAAVVGLYHDAPEVYTGDMPTPVKYFSHAMRENYQIVENNAIEELLIKLPIEMRDTYREALKTEDEEIEKLVKVADKLAAYIKCLEEMKYGNPEFSSAEKTIRKSLDKMDCEELRWFEKHILPSFLLTLDEMQNS